MKRYYRIAGLTMEMDSFGRTVQQAEPYLAEPCAEPDIVISSERDCIRQQYPKVPEDILEYVATGSSFYQQLLKYDGIMLHSSAIVMDHKAYLFTADCGVGKSTHTALWCKVFGTERAKILNDDKPALRYENGKWFAYGTPWSGKTDQSLNARIPLAGIAVLERGEQNEIKKIAPQKAVVPITSQIIKHRGPGMRIKQLELLDKLLTQVPVWKLKCNMDPEAAVVSYEAMSGKSVGDSLKF